MQFNMVFIDLTTNATPTELRPASHFEDMIDACCEQICKDYAIEYGEPPHSFRIGEGPEDRKEGDIAVHFRDTIPEAPEALAYHQTTNGVPDIELGVDLFTSVLEGTDSINCGLSHEILEMLKDSGANQWCDRQDGSGETDAHEICDRVQNTNYPASNGATLSNFLRESAFIPGSEGPWDFMNVMTSQYDNTNGYDIQADEPANVSQVQGQGRLGEARSKHRAKIKGVAARSELQRRRKAHPYSRTSRRGAHV